MKKIMLLLAAITLTASASRAADNSCVTMGASFDCINLVNPSAGYDAVKAARACAGGVSVDCINAVNPSAGYDSLKSAYACKGWVTVECINAVSPSAGYDSLEAANACGGR